MAIDRTNHRLFIGCRSKVLAIVNAETGKVIATFPSVDHVDASAFDPSTGLIFNSTGEGTVDVFHQDSRINILSLRESPLILGPDDGA